MFILICYLNPFLHIYTVYHIVSFVFCVCVCRWSRAFIQIKARTGEWGMDCGMEGLVEMVWAEHCGCFPLANPCDWWLGSIKSLCWRPCQLLINPSQCLLHLGPKLLPYVQQMSMCIPTHVAKQYTQTHWNVSQYGGSGQRVSVSVLVHWIWNDMCGIC